MSYLMPVLGNQAPAPVSTVFFDPCTASDNLWCRALSPSHKSLFLPQAATRTQARQDVAANPLYRQLLVKSCPTRNILWIQVQACV